MAGLAPPPEWLDVTVAYEFLGSGQQVAAAYRRLVAQSDEALLGSLFRADSDQWLLEAVDDYAIAVEEIATFLGRSTNRVYRRVAAARATVGTVPGVALAEG